MNYGVTESHNKIIDEIKNELAKKLSGEQLPLITDFVERYYAMVADEDLEARKIMDLYGAVLSLWKFIDSRKKNQSNVRITNPRFEEHGWQSNHTVIEINVEDMPFLVDSIRMKLNELGYTIYFTIQPAGMRFVRDENNQITQLISAKDKKKAGFTKEIILYIEIDQETNPEKLEKLKQAILDVISDVKVVVDDWKKVKQKVADCISHLESHQALPQSKLAQKEAIDFIKWIENDNFTFFGFCESKVIKDETESSLQLIPETSLGLLKIADEENESKLASIPAIAQQTMLADDDIVFIQQLPCRSTIHRASAPYYIGIKKYDETGELIGEMRFVGLFTSVVYHSSPLTIPIVRKKIESILRNSNFSPAGHAAKHLLNILETYPRDELLQATPESLYKNVMGIFHLQERSKVRLFLRKDSCSCFYFCLVYVPRDQFHSSLRVKISNILQEELKAYEVDFSTYFSESVLARIQFIVKVKPEDLDIEIDEKVLEEKLVDAARSWNDELADSLLEYYGEARGAHLFKKYGDSFPISYKEHFQARTAVHDVENLEKIDAKNPMRMTFYRPLESLEDNLHFKLFNFNEELVLSDILPMLENMGLRVINEHSYEIYKKQDVIRINDFLMKHEQGIDINVEKVKELFQDSFAKTWCGEAENDGFNRLILSAGLNWREIAMLRAYAKYMRQIGFTYSQYYIEQTLTKYASIVKKIVKYFNQKFGLDNNHNQEELQIYRQAVIDELENVTSLDQDKIIQRYLDLIDATLRTNFFQNDRSGNVKAYFSFKIDPTSVPDMPLPKPMFEVFVYAPFVEGVHLRSGRVARGGLRWSDRREDFRTEILGLMKAQQVKNSVIVPAGAKGGFVAKLIQDNNTREEISKEVIRCYSTFISGILDVTDNLVNNEIVPPEQVVRYDEDDYYLVVAADKGTATFSDIANSIAKEYGFWLGDAFASGGSAGYDHKKMGITARGAWESVKSNFLELGIDTQNQPVTVVGIGDMGGDVFGNGMLLSKHIRLIAAFNHMHIFIDPNPDAEKSFIERERLFNLPRSTWADYDSELISAGGGVFNRSAKSIRISDEMKVALDIKVEYMAPSDLIRAILKAPVDLLWNGGIGTYVKASSENNIDVGDRANDALRINGSELRAKVVGEGGNLGLTQLGRTEYSLNKGICYTDFIDNAGGVDCSDHEVNIKILLNQIVEAGDITEKQRNELLADMTDEVAELVLESNRNQTRALSLAAFRSKSSVDEYLRFIQSLERMGKLNRELEFIPDDDGICERKAAGIGLTRPELSVLFAYSKIYIKEEILASDIPEDPYISKELATAFPKIMKEKFDAQMKSHRMRREIIATQLSNQIVNEMGATFMKRLFDETGASSAFIARCFVVAREIFDMNALRTQIEALDKQIDSNVQLAMTVEVNRLLRRATRWFLRNRRAGLEVSETISHFRPKVKELSESLESQLQSSGMKKMKLQADEYEKAGVPKGLAMLVATTGPMISALDIIEASSVNGIPVTRVAETYFALGAYLQLDWFREAISLHEVNNNWDALARAACRDDLDRQLRSITEGVFANRVDGMKTDEALEVWVEEYKLLVERWFILIADLKSTKSREFTMFTVALRELLDLAQSCNKKYKSVA